MGYLNRTIHSRSKAALAICVLIALVVTAAAGPATAPPASPEPQPDVESSEIALNGRRLLTKYCVECHNEKKLKGKLNLAAVAHDPGRLENANAWRQGVGRVRQLEMPPDDSPQPPPAEREALATWMQWNL